MTKISDHEFDDTQPRWSPDGTQIAFAGQTRARQFPKLYVAPPRGGGTSTLAAEDLDLIPDRSALGAGRARVAFRDRLSRARAGVPRGSQQRTKWSPVTSGERAVRGFDVNEKAGVMTYLANDFQHLDDLYAAALDGSGERQLTHLNAKLWAELELARVERLPYKSTTAGTSTDFW